MSLCVSCDAVVSRGVWPFRYNTICGRQQALPASQIDEGDRRGFLALLGWSTVGVDEHYCPEHRRDRTTPGTGLAAV